MNTLKNILFLNASTIFTKIFGILISVLLARQLGELYFGQLMFVFSFTGIFIIFNDLGLNLLVSRDVARNREISMEYLNKIGSLKIVLTIILGILFTGILFLLPYSLELKFALAIGFAYICVRSFGAFFSSFFTGFERLDISAVLDFCFTLLTAIFIFFLSYFDILTLKSSMFAYLLAIFVWAAAGYIVLRTKFIPFNTGIKFNLDFTPLKESLVFAIGSITGILMLHADVIILKFLKGDIPTGYYGIGLTFFSGLMFIGANFSGAMYPVFSRLFKESAAKLEEYLKKSMEALFILIFPISTGGNILSEKIIDFVYGKNYLPAVRSFNIILWASFLLAIGTFLGTFLKATNKQSILLKINIYGVIFNFLASVIFINYFSYEGAAVSRSLTLLFLAVFYYLAIFKGQNYVTVFKYLTKPFIASLLMGISLYFLIDLFSVVVLILIGAVSYFVFLVLIRGFSKEEYNLIVSFLRTNYR